MALLTDIPKIRPPHIELLEALGITEVEHLAEQNPAKLAADIKKANQALKITSRCPAKATIANWISSAIEMTGVITEPAPNTESTPTTPVATAPPVNYEGNEEVMRMLTKVSYAIPMPGKIMMENKIQVGDIPAGLLLSRYSGDLDVRVLEVEQSSNPTLPARRSSEDVEHTVTDDQHLHIDATQVKSISKNTAEPRLKIPKSKADEDRVSLIRAPRESTNLGKDPNSRSYIRGVLHTHPWGLRIGALSSLILLLNLPLAIISALLLLLSSESPQKFAWVPHWILAFPLALPLVGAIYLIWGYHGKCRICAQKLFAYRAALKHVKAHHTPGLGYVLPLCFHLLIFSWFRCSSCGTPVRLKK
jgi:hypothetical protein